MNLTLGVLASVLALLPGLTMIAAFNFRTRRGGARRPELPLTATTALVIAVFISLLVHLFSLVIGELALSFALAFHQLTGIDYGPAVANPIAAGFDAMDGKPITARDAVGLCATLLAQVLAVALFILSDAFDLAFERTDFNNQGWVFDHITRPAENGYTPFGIVYTSTMTGRFGIAYKGAVTDIRHDEKGTLLSIALTRPERFLYEIAGEPPAPPPPPRLPWSRRRAELNEPSGIRHHDKQLAGGVVALDARVINNIVVHSVANSLLREIDARLDEPVENDHG